MKCQLFSGENKKKYFTMSSAENLLRLLSVKCQAKCVADDSLDSFLDFPEKINLDMSRLICLEK